MNVHVFVKCVCFHIMKLRLDSNERTEYFIFVMELYRNFQQANCIFFLLIDSNECTLINSLHVNQTNKRHFDMSTKKIA